MARRIAWSAGWVALAWMVASPSVAQDAEPPTYAPARWKALPSEDQMAEAYPAFAFLIGVAGRATLRCRSGVDGRLSDCEVMDAVPSGLGFDQAALTLTPFMEMEPATRDGAPVASQVRFRQNFSLPDPDPIPAYAGEPPSPTALAEAAQRVGQSSDELAPKMRGLNLSDAELGLPEDRRAFVRELTRDMQEELKQTTRAGVILAVARLSEHPQMRRFLAEGGPQPELSQAELAAAFDQAVQATEAAITRVRQRYCAAYPCDIPED